MGTNKGEIASEMREIGKKEGFKIFGITGNPGTNPRIGMDMLPETLSNVNFWTQDLWTIFDGKLFMRWTDSTSARLKDYFHLKSDFTQEIARNVKGGNTYKDEIYRMCFYENMSAEKLADAGEKLSRVMMETHISGGNMYIVKGDAGDEVIVGADEINKYSVDEIGGMFNARKVTVLPQKDYHIDLFLRPLDKKRILLADDEMSLELLKNAYLRLQNCYGLRVNTVKKRLKRYIDDFRIAVKSNKLSDIYRCAKLLRESGYEVIRVPGNLYSCARTELFGEHTVQYDCNYLNANVFVNDLGDLVYITNKSCVDKDLGINGRIAEYIGFSFERAFIDAISPYVKPEHIYFVKGKKDYVSREMLKKYYGGIHCACSEVPKEDV